MVYTQSEILQKEVFLVDRIDSAGRAKMAHLKCVVFVRPCSDSIHHLCEELRNPKYGQYYICGCCGKMLWLCVERDF